MGAIQLLARSATCLVLGSLASCAHSPTSGQWPLAPDNLANAFNPLSATTSPDAKMSAIDSKLSELISAAENAAKLTGQRDWGSGDVVTAGGLMAVVGGLAERMGLVNTGAALGLIGGTGRVRYQYATQRQAYVKAEAALACIQTQVRSFNDPYRILVISAGEPAERLNATKAPLLAIDAVNKVRRRLNVELEAVSAEAPTRQELESLAAKFAQAASAPAPTSPASAASAAARLSSSQKSMLFGGADPTPPAWLIDDARAVGNSYPAELDKCVA